MTLLQAPLRVKLEAPNFAHVIFELFGNISGGGTIWILLSATGETPYYSKFRVTRTLPSNIKSATPSPGSIWICCICWQMWVGKLEFNFQLVTWFFVSILNVENFCLHSCRSVDFWFIHVDSRFFWLNSKKCSMYIMSVRKLYFKVWCIWIIHIVYVIPRGRFFKYNKILFNRVRNWSSNALVTIDFIHPFLLFFYSFINETINVFTFIVSSILRVRDCKSFLIPFNVFIANVDPSIVEI